jgi:sugar lactone lactonase YvrE
MTKRWLAAMLLGWTVGAGGAEWVTLSGDALLKGPDAGVPVAKVAPVVDLYLFADLPAAPKALWSSWGDGCVASDGKYYAAIGNHLDYDAGEGQSRVYSYDPATKAVKLVVNVRDVVPDRNYAAGKIHARIDQGRDGWLYFATYYGKTPEKASEATRASYVGSALLRYDPASGKTEMLGAPVPKQGVPTSVTDGRRMLMFGYAAYSGDFFVYDLAKRELRFRGGGEKQRGSRNIMLDREGRAYFGQDDGSIAQYDAGTNQIAVTRAKLPGTAEKGGTLRASSPPNGQGIVYGVTQGGTMFAFDPAAQTVTSLGENWPGGQYTAVMVLSPDERFVYYAPGAHGGGARIGTPVVQWDVKSGQKKVLAFLNPLGRERLNYNVGGTYNMKIAPDGSKLFITFNGAMLDAPGKKEQTFGLPCIAVVEIPKEER